MDDESAIMKASTGLEVIAFLDPTIEKLCFEQTEGKTFIHLKFKDEEAVSYTHLDFRRSERQ